MRRGRAGRGAPAPAPHMNLIGGSALLVISDAAAKIADPGYKANLRNRRLVSSRPRKHKHIADLGDFTFRLLVRGVEFLPKRLASGVLEGPRVWLIALSQVCLTVVSDPC